MLVFVGGLAFTATPELYQRCSTNVPQYQSVDGQEKCFVQQY
jgi:hypothetical protein